MKFEAKEIDLKLELVGLDGEEKTFFTVQRVTASFANTVLTKVNKYLADQKEIEELEKDSGVIGILKIFSWIYKNLDTKWIGENFTVVELTEIQTWIMSRINGVKKDVES